MVLPGLVCSALQMSDYGQLRQQLSELRAHVAKTERKLSENRAEHRRMQAELQETIRGLRRQLGRPNKDQLRILEEAEQVKRECQLRLTEAEEEKRMLRSARSRDCFASFLRRRYIGEV